MNEGRKDLILITYMYPQIPQKKLKTFQSAIVEFFQLQDQMTGAFIVVKVRS